MKEEKTICHLFEEESDSFFDIDQIQICIPNNRIPIIIPYGPRACGKTMMILRLCEYLLKRGYHIKPVRDFRSTFDKGYQACCERFEKFLCSEETFPSTDPVSFILLEISDKDGWPICYLFDAEGSCYFNTWAPQAGYPAYINHIICSPNPKQYIFFVEPYWENVQIRHDYVSRIAELKKHCNYKDKAIILYNKIDKCSEFITVTGHVNDKIAAMDCRNGYAGLFDIFRQRNFMLKWLQPYNFKFVPFSSGFFYQDVSGTYKYKASIDLYPHRLWNAILKNILK